MAREDSVKTEKKKTVLKACKVSKCQRQQNNLYTYNHAKLKETKRAIFLQSGGGKDRHLKRGGMFFVGFYSHLKCLGQP